MGRYYSGDIEGKFWFAVQSSDAPSRFGGTTHDPVTICYYFDESHLNGINSELKDIEEDLGENMEKLDVFFKANVSYNDKILSDSTGIPENNVKQLLSDYADYRLGKQIRDCVMEHGACQFEAEF